MSKQGQISPQRYNAVLGVYCLICSPTRADDTSSTGQQHMANSNSVGGYDSLQSTSSMVDNELSVALRGMAVEDEYNVSPQNGPYRQVSQP